MGTPALLVIVRHAQSLRNALRKASKTTVFWKSDEERKAIMHIPDHCIPLTKLGNTQAKEAGVVLKNQFGIFDHIYHSGYMRTKETLEGICTAYTEDERANMVIQANGLIREREPGYAYNMTEAEADIAFPYLKEHWAINGSLFARPPGGENLWDIALRVQIFLNELEKTAPNGKVLIVTHGNTIHALRMLLEHWSYERMEAELKRNPPNASITFYTRTGTQNDWCLGGYYNRPKDEIFQLIRTDGTKIRYRVIKRPQDDQAIVEALP